MSSLEMAAPTGVRSPGAVGPKPWGLPAILLALVIPTGLLVPGFFLSEPEELTTGEIIANLIATLILKDGLFIGIAAAFAVWRYKQGWGGLGLRQVDSKYWWVPFVAAVGAIAAVATYSIVLSAVGADEATPRQEDLEKIFDDPAALPIAAFAVVVMAPLSEEIFFRGFIFGGLIRPLGPIPAMLVSGLIFGAYHVTGLSSLGVVLPFSLIGAFFAWLYYRTGSIWLSIATHFLFNAVGFTAGALGN
jgi:membrane protease YdiL (CAAX protease family)